MKVFKKVKSGSETTERPEQKKIWACEKGEKSDENPDEENSEIRETIEESDELDIDVTARDCLQKNAQLSEVKRDLTIRELDILKERIMPLMPEKEIEWVMMTRDVTNTLTIRDKKAMLQVICRKLEQHADAFAQVKILLVHAAQWPDQYPDPLEEFYKWLLGRYKYTTRQQLIKLNGLLENMRWSWETNPADKILAILHEVNLTWEDVVSNDAARDDFKAIIASKMTPSLYMMLCQKPVNEWYAEITKIWESMRINKTIEENAMANLTKIKNLDTSEETIKRNKRNKICFKCGLKGHIAHNCKTKVNKGKRKNNRPGMAPEKRRKKLK